MPQAPPQLQWAYCYRVKEWFTATKNWDRIYEPGDSREVLTHFTMPTDDDEAAKQHLIARAKEEDVELEILNLEYKQLEEKLVNEQPKLADIIKQQRAGDSHVFCRILGELSSR